MPIEQILLETVQFILQLFHWFLEKGTLFLVSCLYLSQIIVQFGLIILKHSDISIDFLKRWFILSNFSLFPSFFFEFILKFNHGFQLLSKHLIAVDNIQDFGLGLAFLFNVDLNSLE